MSLLDSKNILRYVVVLTILAVSAYVGKHIKERYTKEDTEKDYELVQLYLLNQSPLYGRNKPKLWIHSKYEVNARNWDSFGSRNNTNLNQPYLHLTIKSIVQHCSDDFHIILIDDDSILKLLPDWEYGCIANMAEPLKSQYRQIGLAMLVFKYGGMVVPNSFVCTRSLKTIYENGCHKNYAFVTEAVNRSAYNIGQTFLPDLYFFGAPKKNDSIIELIEFLKTLISKGHFSDEYIFVGDIETWLVNNHKWFNIVDGDLIGIKTYKKRQRILIEDLIEERPIDLSPDCCGIYIDEDEILKRPKYKWFAVMSTDEIVNSNMFLSKYIKKAIEDVKPKCSKVIEDDTKVNSAI